MSTLTFYTNPQSRGQIARWMLEEAGVDYEQVIVQYGDDMKSDKYRAINPMGKVPAIVHDGTVVTECAAICAYVADTFPQANLAPTESERGDYYRWLFFASGPLESAVTNKALGFNTNEEQSLMAGYGTFDLIVSVLDDFLGSREYVCGERFTAADVYLGSHVSWGIQFKTIPETDNFNSYAARLQQRPAYQKAKSIDAQLIADA